MFKLKPSKIETRENISQQQTEQKEKTQSHCVTILLYLSFFFFFKCNHFISRIL